MIKKSRILKFLTLLFVLSTSVSFAFESYEDKKVAKIDVVLKGSEEVSFDKKSVLNKLKTKRGDNFSQLIFDKDLKNLSEDFDKVQPEIDLKENEIYITLHLWPKPIIKEIVFEGNNQVTTKTLRKKLDIKPGIIFNRQDFNKGLSKVKEYYVKKGFYETQVTYSIEPVSTEEIKVVVDIDEGKSGNVQNIIFKGFTKDEKSDLKEMMYVKKYNLLTSWMTGQGVFNKDALEQDRMTILDYLQNKGYADAYVEINILEAKDTNKVILEIVAHRGTLYRVGKVSFDGNKLIDDKDIESAITLKKGEIFSPEQVRGTQAGIQDKYGKKGYIESQVNYETALHENDPVYDIMFHIDEGKCYKVGLIRIIGNEKTKSNVILRESLLVPGQTFDSRKLKATQNRLQNVGYFEDVNVYAVKSSDDLGMGENFRDVYIEVKEKSTGSLNLFVGISSVEDVFGGVEISETNFNYKGLLYMFSDGLSALRGGGEFLKGKVNIGKKQRSYELNWMTPYLKETLWRFGFDVSKSDSKLTSEDFDTSVYGGSVFVSYPLTNYWTYGARWRLRHTQTDVKLEKDPSAKELEEARQIEDSKGLLSGISTSLVYDSVDSSYKPRKGIRSTPEVEFSGIGGKFYFFKVNYINTLYVPLYKQGTLKGRCDFRFLFPFGQTSKEEIPFSEKLFMGGETTVRGYKPFIIGPRMDNNKPLGGISSGLFSLELSHAVFRLMDVFVFADAGSVSAERLSISKIRYSVGVGTRIEVMSRVPITVGYGYPINPKQKEDRQGIFFSMGGQF
jgi:outer membrane protein insertion porin family